MGRRGQSIRHLGVAPCEWGGILQSSRLQRGFPPGIGLEQSRGRTLNRVCQAGRIRIDEFTEAVGAQIPPGDYTTLSGFIYQRLERIPVPKDRIVLPECVLTVDQLDGPRIVQISCTLTKHADRSATHENA